MKKLAGLILMSIIMWFYSVSTTFACSCMMPENPTAELEKADSVFQWTVTNISTQNPDAEFGKQNLVEFDIAGYWKWNINNSTVTTQDSSAACGYNFEEGKDYIVYSWFDSDNDQHYVNLCSRTTTLENASDDIAELWDYTPEVQDDVIDDIIPENNEKNNMIFIILALLVVFGMVFVWFQKANQKK